jgi:hypothetical protein
LNQSPARSGAWLPAADPRWCGVLEVSRIHLRGCYERQTSYLCTCNHACSTIEPEPGA